MLSANVHLTIKISYSKNLLPNNYEYIQYSCSESKCNVYTICRQTQLSTRWYAHLLNVNLNYMFRSQSLAIIRLYFFLGVTGSKKWRLGIWCR